MFSRFIVVHMVIALLAMLFSTGPCAVRCSTSTCAQHRAADDPAGCLHHESKSRPMQGSCVHTAALPDTAFFASHQHVFQFIPLVQAITSAHGWPSLTAAARTIRPATTCPLRPSSAFDILRL